MTPRVDWLPRQRQNQLSFARTWMTVFREETTGGTGQTIKKYAAWGIPADTFAEFGTLFAAAEEALRTAQEKETRTEVTNAACRAAFAALTGAMRSIKRRWLQSPPLTEEDLLSLGLKARDKKPTPAGAPTAKALPEIVGRGQGVLTLRFAYTEGSHADPANKSRRLHYKIVAHGETPPVTPDDLTKSDPMNRKIEDFRFEYGDSGKTVYMAVRLENGDYKGPWGQMISSVIP